MYVHSIKNVTIKLLLKHFNILFQYELQLMQQICPHQQTWHEDFSLVVILLTTQSQTWHLVDVFA